MSLVPVASCEVASCQRLGPLGRYTAGAIITARHHRLLHFAAYEYPTHKIWRYRHMHVMYGPSALRLLILLLAILLCLLPKWAEMPKWARARARAPGQTCGLSVDRFPSHTYIYLYFGPFICHLTMSFDSSILQFVRNLTANHSHHNNGKEK